MVAKIKALNKNKLLSKIAITPAQPTRDCECEFEIEHENCTATGNTQHERVQKSVPKHLVGASQLDKCGKA